VILLIDNYDSFTYNLYQVLSVLDVDVQVKRNDEITVDDIRVLRPAGIVISPGPGNPSEAGVSCDIMRELGPTTPTLGVCLGHQCIASAFGGNVIGAPVLMHGKTSQVFHTQAGVLANLPSPFQAVRYHSLAVDEPSLPASLEVTARSEDGTIMALRHREYPIEGVQFHPESVLTLDGPQLLGNFVDMCRRP
jgi:anthranilate synthase/aminodeoxychorismate synthase-like glutamine amidotransferase